jgi:nicotinamide phosphoribosyltransferase
MNNLILLTDSYKVSHAKQYPPGTEHIYSYFESRGGEFDEVVFFGLQYFLKEYLAKGITDEDIFVAQQYYDKHLGPGLFNRKGWDYILNEHGGKLPVSIKAVPEGTVVPNHNVLMTIQNTDPKCWWLTNYLETLLVQVWYPSTVATISREMKKIIKASLEKSADNLEGLPFKLHDFGCRGVSSMESAMTGGAAHLVNFQGTDTVPALAMLHQFYGSEMAGFSIPAAEHSTMTSWGREGELDAYRNMLETFPTGLVAVVSDSWDVDNAVKRIWGRELKDLVMKREGTLVIRPDSGDPTVVVPRLLNLLGGEFECYSNDKGYRMLPDQVRLIQGDGINRETLQGILDAVMAAGWSTDNLAFGSGGGLLQQCNRDTLKFAFKCSSAVVEGERRDVYKQPATAAWKSSKKGRLSLIKDEHLGYRTVNFDTYEDMNILEPGDKGITVRNPDVLKEVFRNGRVLVNHTLDEVRERARL